jgi:small subunit ribosomal protein S9
LIVAKATEKYYGTGRRKEAVAKVWIMPGSGKITVNGNEVTKYFSRHSHMQEITGPLIDTRLEGRVDVIATTIGGGVTGQAGAIRLGIARAMLQMDESLRKCLRDGGHLSRDPRMKERKKYGQPGARKRFQFSKR